MARCNPGLLASPGEGMEKAAVRHRACSLESHPMDGSSIAPAVVKEKHIAAGSADIP